MKKNIIKFIVNLGLLISGILTIFSGILIQINYHMGNHGSIAINDVVLGVDYQGWSLIHKISIVILSILMIYHIYLHWKWYRAVFTKKLIIKNQQVLVLSLLFVFVAITGLTPWLIDSVNGNETLRKAFIEIHDKIAIILMVYLVLHIYKRMKWFVSTFDKISNIRSTQ